MVNRIAKIITVDELIAELKTTLKDSVLLMITNSGNDSRTVYIASDKQIFIRNLDSTLSSGEFKNISDEIRKALGLNDGR